MAIKKKNSYRLGFLGFIAILCYCLCAMIGLVWVSVGVVWVQGGFVETPVYPDALHFEYPDLNFHNNGQHGNECLRITGITEEMKQEMIDDADEALKPILQKNIIVDRKFVVKCDLEGVNILDINLSSSDPTIATVPAKAKIGEEISVTPTKVNGVNKGGFVEITAWTSQGIYVSAPLKVLVDVPIQSASLSLESKFESEVISTDEAEVPAGLEAFAGERVYYMYENDTTTILKSIVSGKSFNPTSNSASAFASDVRANKGYEFYFDESYNQGNAVVLNSQTGEIKVNSQGIYRIWFRVFKTYDDEIFINEYEHEFEGIDNIIPEDDLYGRYVYAYLNICVKPIVLESIETNNRGENPISLNLFSTINVNYQSLDIKLYSNRHESDYFSSSVNMNKLVLVSSNPDAISVEKIGAGSWNLTALSNQNVYFTLYHQDYPEIICQIDNVEINVIEVDQITFEGKSKYSSASIFNDLVELEVNRHEDGDDVEIIYAGEWSFSNAFHIISANPNLPTSYTAYRVFAVGSYVSGNFEALNITNEQGNRIINVGTLYPGIGYQIDQDYIKASARGEVDLVVCVIKTDINGDPIMKEIVEDDGSGDPQLVETYDIVARSNRVTVRVVELLRNLSASIDVVSGDETTPTEIGSTSEIIIENSSSVVITLIPNSIGALIDASNYGLLRLVYNQADVYPYLDGDELSISFEIDGLNIGDSVNRTVGIQIYTDRYETFITLNFRIINVPIQSIHLNINMEKTNNVYQIYGTPTKTKEGNNVTYLSFWWGQDETVMELLEPTFVPVEIQITSTDTEPIIPRALEVTSYGYTYESGNTDVLQVQDNHLIVKQYGQSVTLRVISTADQTKTDEITLEFIVNSVDFQWPGLTTTTISASSLANGDGVNIDSLGIKATVRQKDGGVWSVFGDIVSGGVLNNKVSITFSAGDEFTKNNFSITKSYNGDTYVGQYISSDNSTLSGTVKILATIETNDGLLITQIYSFTLV